MQKVVFTAATRSAEEKTKHIRRTGMIPANVYIPGKSSIMLKVGEHDFAKLYDHVGESGLVYLDITGDKQLPALVQEVQIDPLTGKYIHVVFRNVSLKEKIVAEVPIEFVGEFDVAGGVLVTVRDVLPLEALPTDMPEKMEVNLADLKEIGQQILVKDIALASDKVRLDLPEEEFESPVVLVQAQQEEVAEETTPETVIIGEEKSAEETPAAAESTDK